MKPKVLKVQQAIYDGLDEAYVPVYADLKTFKPLLKTQVERCRATGRFGSSLKAVRNAKEIARLGLKPGQRVLDAGSGGGILINQLVARYKVKGAGLDLSALALKRAREAGSKAITYKRGVLEKMPFPAQSFDAVVSFDVLEHVEGKGQAIAEIVRVLKPGGRALIYAVSSRDTFTWHWWLRVVTLGRHGHDTGAGHHPDLMASPFLTREQFELAGAQVLHLGYLHSFFSLMLDEGLFWMMDRRQRAQRQADARPAKAAAPAAGASGRVYGVLRVMEFVLNALEWPWKVFGLSNGFFVLAEKTGRS